MAASLPSSTSPLTSTFSTRKTHLKFTLNHDRYSVVPTKQHSFKSCLHLTFQASHHFGPLLVKRASSDGVFDAVEENGTLPSFEERPVKLLLLNVVPTKQHSFKSCLHLTFQASHHFGPLLVKRASSDGVFDAVEENGTLPSFEERPVKLLLLVIFWASVSLAWFAASGDANAASDSIIASSFGLKIASKLRSSGCPDVAVVFALATLPVLELRGAIPVGYWMQLKPVVLTVLSILGDMVPVPIIILYLKKFPSLLAGRNRSASRFLDMLFESAKKKAGPVEEFQWLGLMLFVAVPFPGTGAWTGAIIASILEMPFWSAVSANICGVVLAGLLVNLLVNLGVKYAIVTGVILFFISTFMWSILRNLRTSSSSLK